MKTNGMRKQNAEARVANTHLMKVTELEINALETGPLLRKDIGPLLTQPWRLTQ